ncbi:hypothetical protein ACCO45_013464 [Purpureocillium lilacinum]|uniref:Uncharacterized protein n=1 Tax=Purpureocillium lilacinum TaxID=33203 RepID=A0ACC4D6P3_PURLI
MSRRGHRQTRARRGNPLRRRSHLRRGDRTRHRGRRRRRAAPRRTSPKQPPPHRPCLTTTNPILTELRQRRMLPRGKQPQRGQGHLSAAARPAARAQLVCATTTPEREQRRRHQQAHLERGAAADVSRRGTPASGPATAATAQEAEGQQLEQQHRPEEDERRERVPAAAPAPARGSSGKGVDILADLDALQREVDALRGKMR